MNKKVIKYVNHCSKKQLDSNETDSYKFGRDILMRGIKVELLHLK